MAKRLGLAAALLVSATVFACGGDANEPDSSVTPGGGAGGSGGVTIGPDGVPVGPDGKPIPPRLDGRYELSNEFDITSAEILPVTVNETLQALSNFREKPSQTLVDLLDVANVPVVPNLLNAIPSAIRGLVLGWVDDHVFKALYKNVPVTKSITVVLDDLASILTRFEIVTTLDLPVGDEIGDAKASHRIDGMAYRWSDQRHVIRAPELVANLTTQKVEANAVLLEKLSPQLESGRLTMGQHQFSVPIGSFAVLAADMLAKDKLGAADLQAAIHQIVDCESLAKDVAGRCIDPIGPGKVCVGHETELENFCSIGIDLLVSALRNQIKKLDIPLLTLEEGHAQMWDAAEEGGPLDAVIDRIDKGYWTASVKVGKTDKPILTTFTGRRVGDIPQ